MRKLIFISFLLLTVTSQSQVQKSYSASELLLQLKKLNTVGSVLYIAAHPDDENTRLIAYLANEKCLRTGYMSLTRGDGGQNLIGPEQGVDLGIIRTQELLAARRVDGGEQFFTRAYDFGYSKTPKETFEKWNHDSILGDVVWVIRQFKPDIIITRFATDGSGGHGHHTASAMLAEEAFDAAADPNKFPEQLKYVQTWQARRLCWNVSTFFLKPGTDLSGYIKQDVGGFNTLIGKSYGELAAESRSMHKSQGFGSARQRGEIFEYFKPIKGDTSNLKTIFDGIDFTWHRIKGSESLADKMPQLIKKFDALHPEKTLNELLMYRNLFTSQAGANYDQVLEAFAGLHYEMVAEQPVYAKHDTVKFTVNAICRANEADGKSFMPPLQWYQVAPMVLTPFEIPLPGNCSPPGPNSPVCPPVGLSANKLLSTKYYGLIRFPYENRFFYANGISNNLYVPQDHLQRHLPEPRLGTNWQTKFQFDYQSILTWRNLNYKWVDPEKGEQFRPVIGAPPLLISTDNDVFVFGDASPKQVRVTLKATRNNVNAELKIPVPQGWIIEPVGTPRGKLAASRDFRQTIQLKQRGEITELLLRITPIEGAKPTTLTITAMVDGESYALGMKEIRYDHIPVQTRFIPSDIKLVPIDLKHQFKRIGYIEGAGDEVKTCLEQIGYEVVTLTNSMLATDDLSKYESIVTGVRAYNTNDQLSDYKKRLMDYVFNGGNLIVQYNTNSFAGPLKADLGPYPFKLTRDRITDENAEVRMELPQHPIFNTPNKITSDDFTGWIQERSIYHAGDWDSSYVAPISMNDPGEKPNKGAVIIAKHGKGNYVYTGIVFFRELPAGIPGAYRLLVNMIELKE